MPDRLCCNHYRAALLAVACTGWLHAQDEPADFSATPPAQRIVKADTAEKIVRTARLAYFAGDLQVQRSDNTAAEAAAALNMPLGEGSRLVTGDGGQAEVEFEDGSVARLTPGTVLVLDTLGLDAKGVAETQMSVLDGTAYFELRATPSTAWSVYAAGLAASPTANTILRVSLADSTATFAVFSGSIAARSAEPGGFTANVRAGESLRPDSDDATRYFLNREVGQNDWDGWNQTRDQAAGEAAASRTVARDGYASGQGYGWSDLDANGTWYTAPNAEGGTDELWQPATADAQSFDPYGDGAWVYSGGAYVWASGYTWGWLPYHCGRWLWVDGLGWVWRPSRFCGTVGFGGDGGYGGYLVDDRRHRHQPIERPIPKPGGFHPILRVHYPTSPPVKSNPIYATPVKLATTVATPLLPVSLGGAGHNREPANALTSDFVVDSQSRKPVIGNVAGPVTHTSEATVRGWESRQSSTRSGAAGSPGTGSGAVGAVSRATPGSAQATSHRELSAGVPTRSSAPPPPAAAPHAAAPTGSCTCAGCAQQAEVGGSVQGFQAAV